MNRPTVEEQRQLVRQWEETGRELSRMRWEALRALPYNWEDHGRADWTAYRNDCMISLRSDILVFRAQRNVP